MTEQPAEPDHTEGRDQATDEQRIARALRGNDLANALITMREDDNACAQLIEEAINEDGPIHYDTAVEKIRLLANVVLTLNHRISLYGKDLNNAHGDHTYFARLHANAIMHQQLHPTIKRVNHHDQDGDQ